MDELQQTIKELKEDIKKYDDLLEAKPPERYTNKIIPFIIILLCITAALLVINPSFTGLFTKGDYVVYEQKENIIVNESSNISVIINYEKAEINGIKLSGKVIGKGTFSIHLIDKNKRLLVIDSEHLNKGIPKVTGMEIYSDTIDTDKNIENESYSENETINITLIDSGLIEDISDNISDTNETNITELNETINETVEIEANITENIEENISQTEITEFNFDNECVETCSLLNIKDDAIQLEIELNNVTLEITKTSFIIKKELNLTQTPPTLIREVPNLTIMQGESAVINLDNYFYDENNDILNYSISQLENISSIIEENILTLTPDENYIGKQEYYISASDLNFTTYSNRATITVVQGNLTNATNITETLIQMPATVGQPVKWVKKINIEGKGKSKIKTTLPKEAENIVVKKGRIPLNKNKIIINEKYKLDEYEFNKVEDLKDISFFETIVYYENFTIEYETPAPLLIEESKDGLNKIIHINSDIDYSNVTVIVNITEVPKDAINVYWLLNESDYENYTGLKPSGDAPYKLNIKDYEFLELKYLDHDSNNKIDTLSWIIPHMSNQTFEISINILNVYSKPIVGGLWEIYFNTTGEANLTITAINETTFTEVEEDNPETDDDLEILKLYCGEESIYDKELQIYNDSTYFILNDSSIINVEDATGESLREVSLLHKNYTCNSTGRFIVKVITPGAHDLEFDFGGIKAYAHNDANSPPALDSIILNSTSLMNMTYGNLTAYPINVTDSDNDNVFINYNWKINGSSITILNMPFTNAEYNSSGNQTTYDFSGNSLHGTLGDSATGDANEPSFRNSTQCVYDGCYYFNSIDYIRIPDDSRMGGNNYYTLEFWIKPNVSTGTSFILFYDYTTISLNKYGFIISYSYSTSSILIYTYNGAYSDTLIASGSIANNQWNHVVIVFNCSGYCDTGQNTTVYVNGVKKKDDLLDAPAYSSSDLYIGANSTGGSGFIGWIDEVKYYNRTLSEEQIIANYNEGIAKYNVTVSKELSDEDVWQVVGCPVDGRGLNGTCRTSNNITTIWNHEPTQSNPVLNSTYGTNYTNENLTCYNISTSDIDGDNVTNIITWKVNNTNQLIIYFPFDTEYERTTTSVIRNYANSSMNATLGGGSLVNVPDWLNSSSCKRGGCYNFTNTGNYSTNDFIRVENSNMLNFTNRSFSVECWLKTNTSNGTVPGDFNRGYCISSFNSSNYNEWALRVANGMPAFGYRDNLNNICAPAVGNPGQYADNQWHYYVGVRNWETKRILLYVDGVLAANVTDNCTGVIDTRNPIYLGFGEMFDDPDNYLNGSIDEVAVWQRVLTSEEIAARYNLNYNVIVSQETRKGEIWSCEMTPNDAKEDGTTLSSNTLTINNAPPTHDTPILNSTTGNNLTSDNLTVYVQNASDLDNDIIRYAYDWRKQNVSTAILLMNFDVPNNGGVNKTRDYSSYGHNGTVTPYSTYPYWSSTDGYNNSGAYRFGGNGEIGIAIPYNQKLQPKKITFMARIKTTNNTTNQQILSRSESGGYLFNFQGSTSSFYGGVYLNGSYRYTYAYNKKLNSNQWYHVAYTYDGTTAKVYVDGVLYNSSTAYSGDIYYGTTQAGICIGNEADTTDCADGSEFQGVIDDVAIYDYAMTAEQIAAIANNQPNILVSQELSIWQNYSVCLTPNDGSIDGNTKCSNNLTIKQISKLYTPTEENTASYNITGSISGTMYNGSTSSVNENLTFNHTLYGKRFMIQGNFYTTDVHLENLTIQSDAKKTAVKTSYIYGVESTHHIWIPNNYNKTVIVCPSALSILDINKSCTNRILFYQYQIDAGIKQSNISVTKDGNYYFISNLSNSGAMENTPPNITGVILNSTFGTNLSEENLTAYITYIQDFDGDNINLIYDWRVNQNSLAVINMNFDTNNSAGYGKTRDYTSYSQNGTVTTAKWNSTGGYNNTGAYEFTNTTNYIMIPSNKSLQPSSITLMARFKTTNNATLQQIISRSNVGGYQLNIIPGGVSGRVYLDGGYRAVNASTGINNSQWYHVAFTYDGITKKIYLNGVLVATDTNYSGPIYYSVDSAVCIGGESNNSNSCIQGSPMLGTIDDVAIYPFAMSAEQIAEIAAGRKNIIVSNETKRWDIWQVYITPNDGIDDGETVSSNTLEIIILNLKPTHETPILNTSSQKNTTGENLTVFNQSTSDPEGDIVKNIIDWRRNGSSIAIINMPFEGGTIPTKAKDYSLNSLNGTVVGATFDEKGGYDGRGAFRFSGSTQYIEIPYTPKLAPNQISVEARFNATDNISSQKIISKTEVGGYSISIGETVYCDPSSLCWLINVNGTYYDVTYPLSKIKTNTYYHVVGTYDGEIAKLYVNGELVSYDLTPSGNLYYSKNNSLCIGAEPNATDCTNASNFKGQIDEVRIYNYSLSYEQVRNLYNNITNIISPYDVSSGDIWQACITPNDNYNDGIEKCSNNLTLSSALPPTHNTPILNSTNGKNEIGENLTIYPNGTYDPYGYQVHNYHDWKLNGSSITWFNYNFNFDNSAGINKTKDYSTNSKNGTLYNVMFMPKGGHNNSGNYYFANNDTSYISIPVINLSGKSFTLEAWYKRESANTSDYIFGGGTATTNMGLHFGFKSGNNIRFGFYNNDLDTTETYTDTSSWHHIVGTYDAITNNRSIYHDGQLIRSAISSSDYLGNLTVVGKAVYGTGLGFHGYLDNVRVYDRALTPEQVSLLYNNRTDLIVSQELKINDTWQGCITPMNNYAEGETKCSNSIKILESTTKVTNCTNGCLYIRNLTNSNITIFDKLGNVDVSGNIILNDMGTPDGNDFIIKNISGSVIFWIDDSTGNLRLSGSITQNQETYCTAPEGALIIKDNAGNCVTYIDKLGNLWAKGRVKENAKINS